MSKETRAMHFSCTPIWCQGSAWVELHLYLPFCASNGMLRGNPYLYFYPNAIFNKCMYTYLLLHSLHFIINTLLFSSNVQYWASWVTALYQIRSYWCTFPLLPCPHTIKDIHVLISIMGTKTSISQSKQVSKLYSYSELIIHLVKQLNLSVQSSLSHWVTHTSKIKWLWYECGYLITKGRGQWREPDLG